MTKTVSKEKKMQEGSGCLKKLYKQLRKEKGKARGERKRYSHLNAEFQRIARRGEEAFFKKQCKEVKDNNRMGKARDLFKKVGATKGTFHAKMGMIKNRNSKELTETDEIKKRWQE